MSEAILSARKEHNLSIDDVDKLVISIHPKWLKVCDIKKPRTGLEVKFSYVWLAGMLMRGTSTADPDVYVDTLCHEQDLIAFSDRVVVDGSADVADTAANVLITLRDGTTLTAEHDLMGEIPIDELGQRLRDKAAVVIGDRGQVLWHQVHEQTNLGVEIDSRPAIAAGASG